jgi:hypothetical protein
MLTNSLPFNAELCLIKYCICLCVIYVKLDLIFNGEMAEKQ